MLFIDLSEILKGEYFYIYSTVFLAYFIAFFNKFLKSLLFHPRILWRVLVFLAIAAFPLFVYGLNDFIFIFLLGLVLFLVYLFITAYYPMFYELILLKILFHPKWVKHKKNNLIPNNSKLFLSTAGKLKFFNKLIGFKTKHSQLVGIPPLFQKLHALKLFQKEKDYVLYQEAIFLQKIGAYRNLKSVLDQNSFTFRDSADYYLILADCNRVMLDLEGFHQNSLLALAKNNFQKKDNSIKAMANNNLAVSSLVRGNKEDHKRYLLASLELLTENDENKHNVFPNYIDNLLITNENNNAYHALNQYKLLINFNDFNDTLHWYNYLVQYNRQLNKKSQVCSLIDEMDLYIKKNFLLSESEKALLMSSGLRMRFNGQCNWQPYFAHITKNIDYFTNLPPKDAFTVIKEVLTIMTIHQNQGFYFNAIDLVIDRIVAFLKDYLVYIDNKLNAIHPIFVNKRCDYINQKAYIITRISPENDLNAQMIAFENKIRLLRDKASIFSDQDNKIKELATRSIIIDEIASLDYGSVHAPKETRDAYLKKYSTFIPEIEVEINKCWSILSFYLQDNSYFLPEINDYLLPLSYYYIKIMNENEKSKKLYEKFKQSNISLNHYILVYSHYYDFLRKVHDQ